MKITSRHSRFMRTFAVCAVVIAVAIVGAGMYISVRYTSKNIAAEKFNKIARDYYENYLYPDFVDGKKEDEYPELFQVYTEVGFSPVMLRQLLLFDNAKYADEAKYFDTGVYVCDTNKTYVIYTPHAPFHNTDYEMTTEMNCEEHWD